MTDKKFTRTTAMDNRLLNESTDKYIAKNILKYNYLLIIIISSNIIQIRNLAHT